MTGSPAPTELARRYGPWAVVAGASEGTGACFATQLAAAGINLLLVARRAGPLEELAARIRADHAVEVVTATLDLAAADATDRLAEAAGAHEVGLLVFNAGADTNSASFIDGDIAAWQALVDRNVSNTMAVVHRFAGPMRARGRGGVLLCNSGACYGGLPGIGVYAATKAFGLVLAEALWAELKPHGVDVCSLVMGRTDTPAHRELMERMGRPFPDNCADPDEVARYGLARLPHGPIANWALEDDESGYAGISAAARRNRIEAIARTMVH